MKEIGIVCLFLFFIIGCSSAETFDEMEMRNISWDSISEEARETVLHPMEEATVKLFGIEDKQKAQWINNQFKSDNDKFVAVTYKTKDDGRLGPIVIFIDPL